MERRSGRDSASRGEQHGDGDGRGMRDHLNSAMSSGRTRLRPRARAAALAAVLRARRSDRSAPVRRPDSSFKRRAGWTRASRRGTRRSRRPGSRRSAGPSPPLLLPRAARSAADSSAAAEINWTRGAASVSASSSRSSRASSVSPPTTATTGRSGCSANLMLRFRRRRAGNAAGSRRRCESRCRSPHNDADMPSSTGCEKFNIR